MRKAVVAVFFLLAASSVMAVTTSGDCSTPIHVGADPKDLHRVPKPGEIPKQLAEPLCVSVNSGSGHITTGFLPRGQVVYVRQGMGGTWVVVWVADCGNDVLRTLSPKIVFYPDIQGEAYQRQDGGVPAVEQARGGYVQTCPDRYAANYGQPGECLYTRSQQNTSQETNSRQEVVIRSSNFDRGLAIAGIGVGLFGAIQSYKTNQALRHPIQVVPTKCVWGQCGAPPAIHVVNPCKTCTTNPYPVYGGLPPLGGH